MFVATTALTAGLSCVAAAFAAGAAEVARVVSSGARYPIAINATSSAKTLV